MIFDKLVEIIAEHLGVQRQDIALDTSFKDDLAADSLYLYDLVMAIEEEFNDEVAEEETGEVETVEDIIRILKELGVQD